MAENALQAAIDVRAPGRPRPVRGAVRRRRRAALAPKRKERYAALAAPLPGQGRAPAPGPSFPDYLRRTDAYQDVWRQDIIEWELDGRPVPVLAYIVVERVDHAPFARAALRALLHCVDENVRWTSRARPPIWRTPWARCRSTRCCARSSTWAGTARPGCARR